MVWYSEQPPTALNCNPYSTSSPVQWRLRIYCRAHSDLANISDFDLFWYRRRTIDGAVENLDKGFILLDLENEEWQLFTQLDDSPFSEDMPGDYWCQAETTDGSGQYSITESNVLTVLRPEDYTDNLTPCNEQGVLVQGCAISLDPTPSSVASKDTPADPARTSFAPSAIAVPFSSG